ncbi:MAG: MG2 domain-containing protein [Alistipes sp.]|nr:MG2 domain-containing protein [Alistipes sp.]
MQMTSVLVAILCLVAITTCAFVKRNGGQAAKDGLVLTGLWKDYDAAVKADRPKEMLAVLDTIISKAKAGRLHYDFYHAASQRMTVAARRDWKQRDEFNVWLDKEVVEYDEPIVTFRHRLSKESAASMTDYVLVSKARLQAARNGAFYDDGLDELWTGLVGDDYEYALWILGVMRRSEKAMSLLEEYVGGSYPKSAYLEFRRIVGRSYSYKEEGRAEKAEAMRSFARKYDGRAVSLYAKAVLLKDRFDSLSKVRPSSSADLERSYKSLYADCLEVEKERLSYSKGIDKKIAGKMDDFKSLSQVLDKKEIDISFEKGVVVLRLRNLDKVKVEFVRDAKSARPLIRKTITNPDNRFYLQDTVEVRLPVCDDGKYLFKVRNGKVAAKAEWTRQTLSIAHRADSEALRFFVADYLTGEPLEKVDLELVRSENTVAVVRDVALGKDGFTPLPEEIVSALKKGAVSYLVASYRDKDGFLHKTADHYIYGDAGSSSFVEKDASGTYCEVFTDKSAYNPGETVGFKAVLYRGDISRSLQTFGAGAGVKAELVNPEGKTLCDKDLKTNEYGSVAGSFDLPAEGRNGSFQVRITSGDLEVSKWIVVDEFILPTYDLSFDTADRLFIVGDTLEVSGKVFSFSGHPLSSAAVSYSLDRRDGTLASGQLTLEADGSFTVRFATKDHDYYGGFLNLTVKVVDSTGETKEFSKYVPVLDYFSLVADVTNASAGAVEPSRKDGRGTPCMVSGDKAVVLFGAEDIMRNKMTSPVEVSYSLTDASGEKVVSGKTFTGRTEEIALPKAGLYSLEAESRIVREDGRKVSAKKQVMILRVDDTAVTLAAKVRNFFKPVGDCADGWLRSGEEIKVQFGAGEGPVWAVVELFGDKRQLLEHKIVYLDGKVGETGSVTFLTYNYKEDYPDAVRLMVRYFRDGTCSSFDKEFKRERSTLELPLEFSTFTDKALPGKEYSLTLKSAPGVEAVAAVFDKSSESISPNEWPTVRLSEFGAEMVYVTSSLGGVRGQVLYDEMLIGCAPRQAKVRGLGRNNASERVELMADSADGGYVESSAAPVLMMSKAELAEEEVTSQGVAVRSDFSSSLAFEPFLRSGADGRMFMKFRTSDRLSTFIVQVWAHTKEMRNACVRREVVVTVPVKVALVEPKYLYKGDKYVLRATVSNSSDKSVAGVAALHTYSSKDYEGSKPFASKTRGVTVPAGGSVAVEFEVDPKDHDELGLKVVFADNAKTFSDGVFVSLPVREARQTLTEAHSAVLTAGADRDALVRRLESEFTGTTSKGAEVKEVDIRRMVLDALPSKVEPTGKDVLSLTEALYVRKVAASLGAKVEVEMSDEALVERIKACLNAGGGFGWFEGFRSSPIVTAVVLERFAKMRDAGIDYGGIDADSSVKWLDSNQFLHGGVSPRWCGRLSMEEYAYVRSMYSSVPFDVSAQTRNEKSDYSRNFKDFRKEVKDYLLPSAKDGRGLDGQILAKTRRIKTLANLVGNDGGLALASSWGVRFSAASRMNQSIAADVQSLLEYAVPHVSGGWYYPNAVMPFRGLLAGEAYAHSMLCDLLSSEYVGSAEVTSSTEDVTARQIADGIRLWLMLQKETQKWDVDPAFVDAVNSVLSGSADILATKVVSLTKTYTVPFSRIVAAGNGFSIERHFYKKVDGGNGKDGRLEIFPGMKLKVGDRITAEYRIWSQENRSFIRLTAPREAAFRPVDQLSGAYGWRLNPLSVAGAWSITPQGYRDVKSDRTEYWFDVYPEEKTTVAEDFYITQEGTFSAPVVTIESLYAPHYRANASFGGSLATTD